MGAGNISTLSERAKTSEISSTMCNATDHGVAWLACFRGASLRQTWSVVSSKTPSGLCLQAYPHTSAQSNCDLKHALARHPRPASHHFTRPAMQEKATLPHKLAKALRPIVPLKFRTTLLPGAWAFAFDILYKQMSGRQVVPSQLLRSK